MKNWWYYYKWYVICGAVLAGIVFYLTGNAFGLWTKAPDFQIAYVGESELPQDTIAALEKEFASIGADFNQDGEVIVQINQYINYRQNPLEEAAYSAYASEIALISDISDCESYFFLMDDPDHFQREYQLLASPDGSCPDETDYSAEGKAILWSDCPILCEIAFNAEQRAAGSRELLCGLYIGRRCFYTDGLTENPDECGNLWDFLISDEPSGSITP